MQKQAILPQAFLAFWIFFLKSNLIVHNLIVHANEVARFFRATFWGANEKINFLIIFLKKKIFFWKKKNFEKKKIFFQFKNKKIFFFSKKYFFFQKNIFFFKKIFFFLKNN